MFRAYVTLCVTLFLSAAAQWSLAARLMPRPRVAPTMAHRMAACGAPRVRSAARLEDRLIQTLWFEVGFSDDEKIRHAGDAWGVEEVSQQWFKKDASELSEVESAVVAAIVRSPRRVTTSRLVRAAQYTLINCRDQPQQSLVREIVTHFEAARR